MNLETIKESFVASRMIGHESVLEMIEGDMIVPDIKPDILSLVRIEADTYITDKTLEDNKIKLSGVVDVHAIYVADNESNSLRSLNTMYSFNEHVDIANCKSDMMPIVSTKVQNIEYKILNGRKITVKVPLQIDVRIMENSTIETIKDLSDERDIEVQKQDINFNSLIGTEKQKVTLKENVNLSEGNLPIGEILRSTIEIENEDFKVSYNKVLAKADARVKVIYTADNNSETMQVFETVLPVMGFIDIPGVNDSMKIEIDYSILSFSVKPVYQDMKAMSVSIEAEIEIDAKAYEKKQVVIIKDLYAPDANLKYVSNETELEQEAVEAISSVDLSQTINIPELDNSIILDINIMPEVSENKILDDKVVVSGNVKLDIISYKIDKKVIETKQIEIPFQQVVNVKGITPNMAQEIQIEVDSIEYQLQGNGQLQLKLVLKLKVRGKEIVKFNILDNLELTDENISPMPSVIIYYVKEGDSLWKIAKRFRSTVDIIKQSNNLTQDTIYPGQQLIIPRKSYKVMLDSTM